MAGAGEAVDTAMFTAAIGIDRAVKRNVRRPIEGDDRARRFLGQCRAERGGPLFYRAPAIIVGFAGFRFKPPGLIRNRAPAAMVKALPNLRHRSLVHPALFREFPCCPHTDMGSTTIRTLQEHLLLKCLLSCCAAQP